MDQSSNKEVSDSTATVWRLYESVKDSLTKLANGSDNSIAPGIHPIPIGTADIDVEAGLMSITPDLVENESQASGSPSSSLNGGNRANSILQQAKITIQIPNMFSSNNKSKTE